MTGPYAVTPNTVVLIPSLGALFPRGGPVQDPVLTPCVGQVRGDRLFVISISPDGTLALLLLDYSRA